MTRRRPPAVLVLAILNIVFGGAWTLLGLCGGVAFAFFITTWPKLMAQATAKSGQPPMPDMFALMQERAPNFLVFVYASIGLLAIMGLLLFVSGLGLLRMRNWGWWGSIVFAAVMIVQQLGGVYLNVQYVNPAMAEYYHEMGKWEQQLMPNRPPNPVYGMFDNPAMMALMSLGGVAFNCAYPVVLLIVLNRRHIRAAFADLPPPIEAEAVPNVFPAGDRPPPPTTFKGVS
jgi:hypothetical protein